MATVGQAGAEPASKYLVCGVADDGDGDDDDGGGDEYDDDDGGDGGCGDLEQF